MRATKAYIQSWPITYTAQQSAPDPVRPLECTIDAYTRGERRTHVMGKMREIGPNLYTVTPTYLSGISTPSPARRGPWAPITTLRQITSFDEAHKALLLWATNTVAEDASVH